MNTREEMIEKYQKQEITLAQLFELTPQREAALVSIAYAYFSQEKLDEARNILEGVTVLNENNARAESLLGSIYQKKEEYETAIAKYTRALEIKPGHTYSLANRGEILLRLGRFKDASNDLQEAIKSDPFGKHPGANRARLLANILREILMAS